LNKIEKWNKSRVLFGDERFAERVLSKTVIDLHSGAAVFSFHRAKQPRVLHKDRASDRAGQTGVEGSVENIVSFEQKLFSHVLESSTAKNPSASLRPS